MTIIINSYGEFVANCDHQPPTEGGRLRVTGSGEFRSGGCSAELVEGGNPGTGTVLKLVLRLTAPDGPAPDVITPFEVSWPSGDPEVGLEYTQVQFAVEGTDDEPPGIIDVHHLEVPE